MTPTAEAAPLDAGLRRLGFAPGQVVQELGWDEDADNDLRYAVEDVVGSDLEDEDYGDVAEAVLLWFRDGDGDLVDTLVDCLTNLADEGFIVLLTPRADREGAVQASDVEESAVTAGLHTAGVANVSPDWLAVRLVSPKGARR
ncbi:DUF3052 domain-containing protein [Lapillicoccus jejuensis]|uniref:DUF3052 family protein n=1 Tax=Lapillicoccus jejuensis TaxID=402171 RepID=A0A542E655_9MICO|nr:DUF3052 domain-containing protein [Lapillicoccus jejuensis]TQJ10769.1 DUF3052 family protein [Lapillicoccus jejuensis]